MIQETPQADLFKQQLHKSLRLETLNSRPVTIAKHDHVYTGGDNDETVYFIESGQIKLLMLSPKGRERLLAVHTTGDIFGESCLSGLCPRLEAATAIEETILKQIPCPEFFLRV
jgi:CRP/FNR family transcriptional regulator, cyclic AMP receptor protein